MVLDLAVSVLAKGQQAAQADPLVLAGVLAGLLLYAIVFGLLATRAPRSAAAADPERPRQGQGWTDG